MYMNYTHNAFLWCIKSRLKDKKTKAQRCSSNLGNLCKIMWPVKGWRQDMNLSQFNPKPIHRVSQCDWRTTPGAFAKTRFLGSHPPLPMEWIRISGDGSPGSIGFKRPPWLLIKNQIQTTVVPLPVTGQRNAAWFFNRYSRGLAIRLICVRTVQQSCQYPATCTSFFKIIT